MDKVDVKGKIVVVSYSHGYIEYELLRSVGYYLHDPGDTLSGKGQVMSWVTEEEQRVYQAAVDRGAVGFIGVYPLDITPYLCFEGGNAFTGMVGPIPGIGLRNSDGKRLISLLKKGAAEGTLILTGETRSARMHNIVGDHTRQERPGDPGYLASRLHVAGGHRGRRRGGGGAGAGAPGGPDLRRPEAAADARVCPGGGRVPVCPRLAGLTSRGTGTTSSRTSWPTSTSSTWRWNTYEDETGVLVATGDIQARALFVTDTGPLVEIVRKAVIANNLRRTILMPTNTPLGVPTDASAYNRAGLPVISFISPPPYWNGLEDTWEKIAVDQLLPTAAAYRGDDRGHHGGRPRYDQETGPAGRRVYPETLTSGLKR